jgi:hypothetical protein
MSLHDSRSESTLAETPPRLSFAGGVSSVIEARLLFTFVNATNDDDDTSKKLTYTPRMVSCVGRDCDTYTLLTITGHSSPTIAALLRLRAPVAVQTPKQCIASDSPSD